MAWLDTQKKLLKYYTCQQHASLLLRYKQSNEASRTKQCNNND